MSNSLNIFVIDDDDVYQFTVIKTLESFKLASNVTAFSDGEEALDFIQDNLSNEDELPDVILLDINMPIMDGFEFLEEFAKVKLKVEKKITIYMVSSSVDPVDIERAKSISSISDYIIKPINRENLKSIFERLKIEKGL